MRNKRNKCTICGTTKNIVNHHIDYKNDVTISMCRKHDIAISKGQYPEFYPIDKFDFPEPSGEIPQICCIKINPRTQSSYIPNYWIEEKFIGDIPIFSWNGIITLIRPDLTLDMAIRSIGRLLAELKDRKEDLLENKTCRNSLL